MHLLLDDDEQVRSFSTRAICNMEPKINQVCTNAALEEFFKKFANKMCKKRPYISTVILFSWGTNLVQDEDFEMDDSEVSYLQ